MNFADYYDFNSQNNLIYNDINLYSDNEKSNSNEYTEYKKIQHNLQIKKKNSIIFQLIMLKELF